MSMREKMLKSAINSIMDDYEESVQRMEIMSKRDNTPFIYKENQPYPYISCYMCGSKECEEIRYGNKCKLCLWIFELSRTGKNTYIPHNKNRQQHY